MRNPDALVWLEHFKKYWFALLVFQRGWTWYVERRRMQMEFRFLKNIYHLGEILQILNQVRCYNRIVADKIEALCIFLKRFTYPCRYADMLPMFARADLKRNNEFHLGNSAPSFEELWSALVVSSKSSKLCWCTVIHAKGAPVNNCWGFIDGTMRPVSRPGKTIYNGHKHVHVIKFQLNCCSEQYNCTFVWPCCWEKAW